MKLLPVVAGSFYPGNRKALQSAMDSFVDELPLKPPRSSPVGLLLPHAGYVYSGAVAALGYRSLSASLKTVVVAGPSHYVSFNGASIFPGESVMTPLGEVPVDQEACRFLMGLDSRISEMPAAFAREHSVEVHFPFLRRYLPGVRVVPIVMGQGFHQSVEPLVAALLRLWEREPFLFIASSDLSHYPSYETAKKADREILDAILSGNEVDVEETDERIMSRGYPDYHCTHCGKEPVAALLRFARGVDAGSIELLGYRNSGDVTGDRERVVGYGAVSFSREKKQAN